MYKSFRVKNFRCFKDLQINDLGRVNLIAGKNNTGKTALLEAMYLLTKPLRPNVLLELQRVRGIHSSRENRRDTWELYFSAMNTDRSIQISGRSVPSSPVRRQLIITEIRNDEDYIGQFLNYFKDARSFGLIDDASPDFHDSSLLRFTLNFNDEHIVDKKLPELSPVYFPSNSDLPAYENTGADQHSFFIPAQGRPDSTTLADQFSRLELAGSLKSTLRYFSVLEPRLKDLRLLSRSGRVTIWGRANSSLIPLRLMGEGANRFANFILTMLAENPKYLFIDEIENGIHHTVQCKVWHAIGKLARELDIQVFATTHSLEMVHAAYEAFSENSKLDEFRYHRLDRHPDSGDIEAVTYNESSIEAAITTNWEIRG